MAASEEGDKLVHVPISKSNSSLLLPDLEMPDWKDFSDIEKEIEEMDKKIQKEIEEKRKNLPELKPVGVAAEQPAKLEKAVETDKEGNQHLILKFEVRMFKPSEIKADLVSGRKLRVYAEHKEEKKTEKKTDKGMEKGTEKAQSSNHGVFEFIYLVPEELGALSQQVTAKVSPDGILQVDVPFKNKIKIANI